VDIGVGLDRYRLSKEKESLSSQEPQII
jgi:hypothetical protein